MSEMAACFNQTALNDLCMFITQHIVHWLYNVRYNTNHLMMVHLNTMFLVLYERIEHLIQLGFNGLYLLFM